MEVGSRVREKRRWLIRKFLEWSRQVMMVACEELW